MSGRRSRPWCRMSPSAMAAGRSRPCRQAPQRAGRGVESQDIVAQPMPMASFPQEPDGISSRALGRVAAHSGGLGVPRRRSRVAFPSRQRGSNPAVANDVGDPQLVEHASRHTQVANGVLQHYQSKLAGHIERGRRPAVKPNDGLALRPSDGHVAPVGRIQRARVAGHCLEHDLADETGAGQVGSEYSGCRCSARLRSLAYMFFRLVGVRHGALQIRLQERSAGPSGFRRFGSSG